MKKLILGLSLFAVAATISCKKDDKKSSGNTWTADGTENKADIVSVYVAANSISAVNASTSAFSMIFNTLPTASGKYKIVATTPASANEMVLSVTTGASMAYTSTGVEAAEADVTVSGGKITVVVPSVEVKNIVSGATIKVSANLTETTRQ